MDITVNGKAKTFPEITSLNILVSEFCQDKMPVVAELNGEIIKRPQWQQTVLKEGDTVELVSFVGGG